VGVVWLRGRTPLPLGKAGKLGATYTEAGTAAGAAGPANLPAAVLGTSAGACVAGSGIALELLAPAVRGA
jgi:hypothetical protein